MANKKLEQLNERFNRERDAMIAKLQPIGSHIVKDNKEFKGYWYVNKTGHYAHTWDFEESIGELD